LNKLNYILTENLLLTMYTSLILRHINYGILLWGYQTHRVFKLQKRAMRICSLNKSNAHTDPAFHKLKLGYEFLCVSFLIFDLFTICIF